MLSVDSFGFYTDVTWSDFTGTPDAASSSVAEIAHYFTYTLGEEKEECKEIASDNCVGKKYKVLVWNKTAKKYEEKYIDCEKGCQCFECSRSYPSFTVLAKMKKESSWVKEGSATAALLGHEQLHLWIAEKNAAVATPKIRKVVGKGVNCTVTSAKNDALADWTAQKNAIWTKMQTVDSTVQVNYDAQTAHGTDDAQQAAWKSGFEGNVDAEW